MPHDSVALLGSANKSRRMIARSVSLGVSLVIWTHMVLRLR